MPNMPSRQSSQPGVSHNDNNNNNDSTRKVSSDVQAVLRKRRLECAVTLYGIAFAPPCEGHEYLVGCTSLGYLHVWRMNDSAAASSDQENDKDNDDDDEGDIHNRSQTRRKSSSDDSSWLQPLPRKPVLQWKVTNAILYHVDFVHSHSTSTSPLLVTAGQGGVYVYRWFRILQEMEKEPRQPPEPCAILRPHVSLSLSSSPPSLVPTMDIINGTSADTNFLYGAGQQLYKWNLETSQCVAILSAAASSLSASARRRKPNDYLHTVKSVPKTSLSSSLVVTGGNDGKIAFWDGAQESLVHQLDGSQMLQNRNKTLFVGGEAPPTVSALWVSSLDVSATGNFLTWGGGLSEGGGVVGQVHVPSRTLTSAFWTRECIQNVVSSSQTQHDFVTVGNECVVSYWERQEGRLDRSGTKTGAGGRAWITSPSAYALASCPQTQTTTLGSNRTRPPPVSLAVAGRGPIVDCFANRGVKVCQLTVVT